MALHLLYQLSLKINIFRHGTCFVARAIVATPGMAHLHLHHAGAELSIHRGRLPVMVPVVVVVVLLLLNLYWNICEHTTACNGPRPNPHENKILTLKTKPAHPELTHKLFPKIRKRRHRS